MDPDPHSPDPVNIWDWIFGFGCWNRLPTSASWDQVSDPDLGTGYPNPNLETEDLDPDPDLRIG